ncbi:GumC family protein [Desulfobulbus elongatus]|uniref:GumC family protein n=1 Tax=Desulfobulbus elongatus TaxID=53332 RepID=UPI000A009078|nr:GNVR domain-containing protein [Desulfobulbus elongatus]
MNNQQRQLIKKYVDLVLGRWRLIASSLLLAITIGLGYYIVVPKLYQSTALLSYEQQQINPGKMDPEQGNVKLRESLATLRELVTSRNSLEKVILQFSLYEEARKNLPIEDVIEGMRRNIEIEPAKQGDIFSVSFQGEDPQKVAKVTNALAALFIEENLKYREERATETSKYTQSELALAKKVLDEKEQQMRDYKLKYFNEMPEQRQSNLSQLQALMKQNQDIQNSIQELERTKVLVQEQMNMQRSLASLRATSGDPAHPSVRQTESDADRLLRLQAYLEELQGKYTENHPEVRRTKQQILQLEGKVGKGGGARQTASPGASRASLAASLEAGRIEAQLKQLDINIQQLREAQAKIPPQIDQYQKWIAAVPTREAEWTSFTRDYSELRRHYDQLVAQNLQAQSVENLERNQKGSKFKIVDSARLPEKPFKPNFLKILLVAVAAGLGASFGYVLLLDFIDTSFKNVGELEEYIGVPVICSIPFIEKEAETRRERMVFRVSFVLIAGYAVLLMGAIAFMWIKGMVIV